MQLLSLFSYNKLNYVVLFLAIIGCIGNIQASSDNASNIQEPVDSKTPVIEFAQKSVKKELNVQLAKQAIEEISPTPEKLDNHKETISRDEKSPVEGTNKKLMPKTEQKSVVKTDILGTVTESMASKPHLLGEDFVLQDEESSESIKTGFYFFLILSSGAMLFIAYKIYRLRLSRAERKYGVQSDRSTQELTPLPISIEDGHSDDEDQTLFDIQRQNIRIL